MSTRRERPDNATIVEARRRATVDMAAASLGITRGVVSGVCWRAGVKMDRKPCAAVQAAAMREDGKSVGEIMAHFGWTKQNAYNQISRGRDIDAFRAKRREQFRAQCEPSRRQDRADAVAAKRARIADHVDAGATWIEAAQRFGVSVRTVARACQSRCATAPERGFVVDEPFSNIAKQRDESVGRADGSGVEPAVAAEAFQKSKQ